MSKKFSNYTKSKLEEFGEKNESAINTFKESNKQDYEMFNEAINRYSGMSENELFNEFIKVAQQKKQDGTLTLSYIENIRNTIFPLISPQQQQIFNELVNYIK